MIPLVVTKLPVYDEYGKECPMVAIYRIMKQQDALFDYVCISLNMEMNWNSDKSER